MPVLRPGRRRGCPPTPATYEYDQAARDALTFAALFDRFIQNLRRYLGYDVQYFAAVEPQRRLAPHVHIAMRGTVARAEIRRVLAATYHQVWWPDTSTVKFGGDELPVWDDPTGNYLDPATGEVLPTWDQALDELSEPYHVARFGVRFDAQGVLAGSKDAARCIGYLTKYLIKQVGECHHPDTDAARAHAVRLAEALRFQPCSPRCANWLRYGIQPKNPRPGLVPGRCKGKAHDPDHLGYAGRRVLVWLTLTEAEIIQGGWIDPDAGRVVFGNYASDWIGERPGLRPKTTELYRYLLRRHLSPPLIRGSWPRSASLGTALAEGSPGSGVSAVTVAKAYRLLKAILNTAVDDSLIRRNPCRIKGAGQEKSVERPVLTVPQVYALATAMDERYRALVLLAAFSSLRWGELAALRRSDIGIQARTVRVVRQLNERDGGGFAFGPPKSEAGVRVVAIPELITPDLAAHVVTYARPGDDGLVFTSPGGGPLRHTNFRRRFWVPAVAAAGLSPIHFHDLRHTGNMLAADAGANLRELMDRMGHSTTRAATVYLHGGTERQQAIADEVTRQAAEQLGRSKTKPSGTQRARRRRPAS